MKIKNALGKLKIETPKNIFIDEFIALRSKAYSFKCNNNDEIKKQIERYLQITIVKEYKI